VAITVDLSAAVVILHLTKVPHGNEPTAFILIVMNLITPSCVVVNSCHCFVNGVFALIFKSVLPFACVIVAAGTAAIDCMAVQSKS